MMKKAGVAILGLGVVGGGTYRILTEHREFYRRTQNVDISVESVLVRNKQRALDLGVPEENIAGSIAEVIANPNVDIVVECIGGVEAAKDYVMAALHEGKSVVTSNKELICKYSHELERTARRNCCGLYFEASCVGGVPIVRTLLDGVQGNRISEMMGIINGTTNYILSKMTEENEEYAAALAEAQRLGYAEADPTNDVEGVDAAYKLAILSSLAFHTKVPYAKVYREGISSVERTDIVYGKQLGYTLKLLAIGKNTERGVEARVHPAFIRNAHPLASVRDAYNAVYLRGDAMDDIMLYGRGAGALPTGSAVVSDIIYAATHSDIRYSTFRNTAAPTGKRSLFPILPAPIISAYPPRIRRRARQSDGHSRPLRRVGDGAYPKAPGGRRPGRARSRRLCHARDDRKQHPRRGEQNQRFGDRAGEGAHPRGGISGRNGKAGKYLAFLAVMAIWRRKCRVSSS